MYTYMCILHTHIYTYMYIYIYNDIHTPVCELQVPEPKPGLCFSPAPAVSANHQGSCPWALNISSNSTIENLKRPGISLDVCCPRVIVVNCLTNQQPMFEFGLALLRCEPRVTESDRFLACQIIAWVTVLIAICPPTDN